MTLIAGCGLCGCAPEGRPPGARASAAHEPAVPVAVVPGLDLGPRDDILSLDLAVGERSDLHVAWSAQQKADGVPSETAIFYARRRSPGDGWSRPVRVTKGSGPVRLIARKGRVDLVTGVRPRHWRSEDDGVSWLDLGEVLTSDERGGAVCDLTLDGGTPVVACVVRPQPPYERGDREPRHRQRLVVRRLAPDGAPPGALARLAASLAGSPPPRLLVAAGVSHLLAAVNEERWEGSPGGSPAVAFGGRLHYWSGRPEGGWSEPVEIPAPASGIERVEGVELLATSNGLYALWSARGIFVSRTRDGRQWSQPRRIDSAADRPWTGELAAAGASGSGGVIWVDARHRRSDSRWWNPLGGLPWSDDTHLWMNNDLYAVDLAQIDALLDAGQEPRPRRLTSAESFARQPRLEPAPEGRLAAWAGRRRVGRRLDSFDQPPEIFIRTPALDGPGAGPGEPTNSSTAEKERQ